MEAKLSELKSLLGEIYDILYASYLLGWDQQTYMPRGGAEGRGYQQATLEKLAHIKYTSTELGKLLDDLQPHARQLDPDSDDARLVQATRREFERRTRVPAELVAEVAQATAVAHPAWEKARAGNDFASFRPHLEKIFDLRRKYAGYFAPYHHIYDPLLDQFEPGLKTADVKAIFKALRPQQVALLQAIAEQPQVDDSFLHQPYDRQKQWDFGVEVITKFGYDWSRGRQDYSAHPFTQNMGIDDVRITTRILPDFLPSALFSSMHEAGHALYEQGIDHALARSPLAAGASLAVHESQSRLWENMVGSGLPFWEHFYPSLQQVFPSQLGSVSLEQFYRAINKVQPSMVRVEADEATYNLHVMLRLELEIAVLEGAVEVKDLPEAWNARMSDYLGVIPETDSEGVLQDVHWSGGTIGYFPTYALGNLISAQLWETVRRQLPDLDGQIRQGDFSGLLGWLRTNIHQHGAKFEPQELVERVTGSKIDPAPYMRYLWAKYGEIYGLRA